MQGNEKTSQTNVIEINKFIFIYCIYIYVYIYLLILKFVTF